MTATPDAVSAVADQRFEEAVARLCRYVSVPAISSKPAHAADVARLCHIVRDDLEALGLQNARVLALEGAHPAVAAEWTGAGPDAPTVLVYGHLDLQPADEPEWVGKPHEPRRVGDRLYGRGTADDMGGWVSHFAALEAYLTTTGKLPCNVKLLIEGEEEIGSPHLEAYMDAYPDAFEADVMVLTDCDNPSPDVPGLTISLRGLVDIDLVCEALDADIHSGLWGNLVPDVSIALVKLISRLADDDGRMVIGRVDPPAAWREAAWDIPLGPDVIRSGAHLSEGIEPLPDRGRPPAEWAWRQPAVTIIGCTLPRPEVKKNALRRRASANLSIRVPPGTEAKDLAEQVRAVLLKDPPGGVKVTATVAPGSGESWLYEPKGAAFEAADRAYRKAWGTGMARIGIGGTIPFVALFGRRFSHVPLILNGVIDPATTAHGPNESLHLGVFRKAIAANVHLLAELGALGKAGLR